MSLETFLFTLEVNEFLSYLDVLIVQPKKISYLQDCSEC